MHKHIFEAYSTGADFMVVTIILIKTPCWKANVLQEIMVLSFLRCVYCPKCLLNFYTNTNRPGICCILIREALLCGGHKIVKGWLLKNVENKAWHSALNTTLTSVSLPPRFKEHHRKENTETIWDKRQGGCFQCSLEKMTQLWQSWTHITCFTCTSIHDQIW